MKKERQKIMAKVAEIKNSEFGKIRVMVINSYPWMIGEDVATALGYEAPEDAIMQYAEIGDMWGFHDEGGEAWAAINKRAVFDLARNSNHPKAGAFLQWLINDIWSKEGKEK